MPQSTPTGCPTTALDDAPVKPFKNKEEVPARSVTLLRYIDQTPLIFHVKLPALTTSAPRSNSSPWFSRVAAFAYLLVKPMVAGVPTGRMASVVLFVKYVALSETRSWKNRKSVPNSTSAFLSGFRVALPKVVLSVYPPLPYAADDNPDPQPSRYPPMP